MINKSYFGSILCVILLTLSGIVMGQGGIGISSSAIQPDGSAMLDVSSTTKGILIPRMTAAQRSPGIVSPATGLIVYQTDGTTGLYMNTGTPASPNWVYMFTSGSGAVTGTGNANQVAFWNGTGTLTSNSNLFWDNTNARLGIGNSSPSTNLDITGNAKISGQLTSTVATGTAPLVIASTTLVPNLHAATADLAATATNFSGALAGDVSGTQGMTAVNKIKGVSVSTSAPTNTQVLKYNATNTQWEPATDANSGGTLTTLSIVSTNGFTGIVSNPTTTPAITLSTNVTGMIKANGTSLSAAVAGTDYITPNSLITAGTYPKIQFDSKGMVLSGTTLVPADIPIATPIQGDVTGFLGNATVASVASIPAASIASGAMLANGASSNLLGNTIVKRDALGNFLAGNIQANLLGNATTATTANSATNFTGTLSGDVTGTQTSTTVTKIRNIGISTTVPSNTNVLTYNSSINQWEPKVIPVTGVQGTGTASRLAFWTDGTTIASNTNLYWDDANARLGMNTTTPEFRLTMNSDGGIMAKGSYSVGAELATAGAGTRMMWYPRKGAFRVGGVNGNKWDDVNIGEYSFSMGWDTKASALYSIALGAGTTASGMLSTAIGSGTTAGGENSTAMGAGSSAGGYVATALGKNTNASADYSTAMGNGTIASSDYATAMGHQTTASGFRSTAMGYLTVASGTQSTSMGVSTIASGSYSTAMGNNTTASGNFSTAIGNYASTSGFDGSVVIGDNASGSAVINATANSQFSARFNGGYRLFSAWTLTTGVLLTPGSGSWTSVSDRKMKENFQNINTEDILVKVCSMPISNWNYITQASDVRHIGPMAQDFYKAFHLDGQSDTTINTLDIDGINMAAIQGLKVRTDELRKAVAELDSIKSEVNDLKYDIEKLKKLVMLISAPEEQTTATEKK